MKKKYYVKAFPRGVRQKVKQYKPAHPILRYAFVSANAVVGVLLFLLVTLSQSQSHTLSALAGRDIAEVQGVATAAVPTKIPTPTLTLTPTPTGILDEIIGVPIPTVNVSETKKTSYRIAVYGDSMEDTMGELLEYLDHALKRKYPNTTFALFNYGIGSQNVEDGLLRFGNEFSYQTRRYPPISQINADIIIIGSFAYNPFTPYDRNRHWLGLTHLVELAKQQTNAQIYLLAEIPPLKEGFGEGPGGVNWSDEAEKRQVAHIKEQLENTVALSDILRVPLIDVYGEALKMGEKAKIFTNPSDGIHPSVEGHEFIADIITKMVRLD